MSTDKFKESCSNNDGSNERIIVIGAGAAGLCALGRLMVHGQKDVILLEKGDHFGGVWFETNYPNLTIHSKSYGYKFFDFHPITSKGPRATKEEVMTYFGQYVEARKMANHICLHKYVERIEYLEGSTGSHRCNVIVKDLDSGETIILKCTYVICALGFTNAGQAHRPVFEGEESFTGKVLHTSEYRTAHLNDIAENGKKVCVLGAGKSAYDNLLQFIDRGLSDNVTWTFKKALWGYNYDYIYSGNPDDMMVYREKMATYTECFAKDPESQETLDAVKAIKALNALLNVDESDNHVHQMRSAVFKPHEVRLIREKITRVRSGIKSLSGDVIELENGDNIQADYLLCATGYERGSNLPRLQILHKDGSVQDYDVRKTKVLFRGVIDPKIPAVFIFTAEVPFNQQLYGYSIYGEWLARFIHQDLNITYSDEDIIEEIKHVEKVVKPGYAWCPEDSPFMSKGMSYSSNAFVVCLENLKGVFRDFGIEAMATELPQHYNIEEKFIEIDEKIREACSISDDDKFEH